MKGQEQKNIITSTEYKQKIDKILTFENFHAEF